MPSHERYIPALGLAALTLLYDPFLRFVLRETTFKHAPERAADTIDGQIIPMLQQAKFDAVGLSAEFMTLFGTLALYHARKSDRPI